MKTLLTVVATISAAITVHASINPASGMQLEQLKSHRPDHELTPSDFEELYGPSDLELPKVKIMGPSPGAPILVGSSLTVTVEATDNKAVESVGIAFDVDGTGSSAFVSATRTGANTFTVTFPNISGPAGPRTIRAFASDPSGHTGIVTRNVEVSTKIQGDSFKTR